MSTSIPSRSAKLPPIESGLTEIWRQALGVDSVGLHDDFFRLGGDSLSAAEVMVAIQQVFGQQLPLAVLHKAPTIQDLATLLHQKGGSRAWSCLVALQP